MGERIFLLKLESALAVFSIAQTAAGNLITTMLCAVEAGSTVGKKGTVLMPTYAVFQSRSTPEIPSQVDIKRGVGMGTSSSLSFLKTGAR